MRIVACGRQNIRPPQKKNIHVLILNLWNMYILPDTVLKGGGVLADMIKLGILRWGDYHGVFRWTLNVVTCILTRGKQEILHTQKKQQCDTKAETKQE